MNSKARGGQGFRAGSQQEAAGHRDTGLQILKGTTREAPGALGAPWGPYVIGRTGSRSERSHSESDCGTGCFPRARLSCCMKLRGDPDHLRDRPWSQLSPHDPSTTQVSPEWGPRPPGGQQGSSGGPPAAGQPPRSRQRPPGMSRAPSLFHM